MISAKLHIFGITRVAEVTGLDEIGIPVFVAYRPDSKTVTVSIGTGLDPMQARVSAAMESVEVWHAENVEREPEFRGTAADVRPPYDLRALNVAPHSPLTEHCVLDWVTGTGLLTGRPVPVPLDTMPIDFTGRLPWSDALFRPTTNGVASGSTSIDAVLHGLHEVAERECIAEYLTTDPTELRYCDIEEENSEYIQHIVARLRDAGCVITLIDITNRLGIPCYAALVWSPDVPYRCGGFGCHIDPEIAVGRALLEAAQSRLAAISGARDDIDADTYLAKNQDIGFPGLTEVPAVSLRHGPFIREPDLESVVRSCAGRIKEVTGFEPFTVDLAHNGIGIPVQKTYAPGVLMFDHDKFTASQPITRVTPPSQGGNHV